MSLGIISLPLVIITLSCLSITNLIVHGEPLSELMQDQTRATTSDFSIKPLDNWAYGNANYGSSIFGFGMTNNAVEMRPNLDNFSDVYGLIAKDDYFNLKNAELNLYVQQKMKDSNLKYLQ